MRFPLWIDSDNSPTHVQHGRLLQWTGDSDAQWLPAARLVGRLDTTQRSCPCVYADLYSVDAQGAVLGRYQEETRWQSQVTLTTCDLNGQWWRLEYVDDQLQTIAACAAPQCGRVELQISDAAQLVEERDLFVDAQ
jgi:hypothetical protein